MARVREGKLSPSPPPGLELSRVPTIKGKKAAWEWINKDLRVELTLNHVVTATNKKQIPRTIIRGAIFFSTQDLYEWVMGYVVAQHPKHLGAPNIISTPPYPAYTSPATDQREARDRPRLTREQIIDRFPAINWPPMNPALNTTVQAVLDAERIDLALAADRMARELLGIATGAESEAVKLAAVKDALDRAGLGAKTEVALELKPWEDIMADVAGVATITRAESRARRGLPDDASAPAEPLDIVDAELVDEPDDAEAPETPPSSTGDACTPAERVTGAKPPTATATPHVGRELQTLDEAAHDAARANRSATRVGRVRRVR